MKPKTMGLVATLIVCSGLVVWIAMRPTPSRPSLSDSSSTPIDLVPQKSPAELRAERERFFERDVEPSIAAADQLNREAADRCITRIKESFNGYRVGIEPFCEEVNTWGTRFGVIRRMPGDWWNERSDVRDYIQGKFGKHIFTDEVLEKDIASALEQFRDDVRANQNVLITDIRAAISTKDMPGLPEIDYSEFGKALSARLRDYTAQSARDSVVFGIVTEVASGVGGMAAEQLLAQLAIRLTAMVGSTTASAGGATVGGAAVGGGGGALGGPVGVVAGLAVGLVIGGAIDWWMSSKFEAKLAQQLNTLIDQLIDEVIAGDANHPGLQEGLSKSCDVIRQAYQDSLRTIIVQGDAS